MKTSLIVAVSCLVSCALGAAEDLRTKYATTSIECAQTVDKAITLATDKQYASALEQAELALKSDPNCLMARLWLANILLETGEFDRAMTEYTKVIDTGKSIQEGKVPSSVMGATFAMALALAKVGKTDDAAYWFSQLVMMDMDDDFKYQWKAYRNLAIISHGNGDDLSALVQTLKAKELAPARVDDAMLELFSRNIRKQPTVNLLSLKRDSVTAEHPSRKDVPRLQRLATLETTLQHGLKVRCIVRDAPGKRIFVFYDKAKVADVIHSDRQEVRRVELPCAVTTVDAAGTCLYAARSELAGFVQMDLDGKLVRTYELPDLVSSLAVCPITRQAFVAMKNSIQSVDLETGKCTQTELVGQVLSIDPRRKLVYATYYDEEQDKDGLRMALMNNRPVFYGPVGRSLRGPNLIMKALYRKGGTATIATIRLDAAVEGRTMDVSLDGRWITVTGTGGYHGPGTIGGAGTAVLCVDALDRLEGFYPIDEYPQSATFSPGCEQLAVASSQELRVYNLGRSETPFVHKGSYAPPLCWSGDGSLLVAATSTTGVHLFTCSLTADEKKRYGQLADKTSLQPKIQPGHTTVAATPKPRQRQLANLQTFQPTTNFSAAVEHARTAFQSTNSVALPLWVLTSDYGAESGVQNAVLKVEQELAQGNDDPGVKMYQIENALRTRPGHLPAVAVLGRLQLIVGKTTEAVKTLTTVVRKDAGLTSLSSDALCNLGRAYEKLGQDAEALDTLAAGLSLDCGHQPTLDAIKPLLRRHKISAPVIPNSKEDAADSGAAFTNKTATTGGKLHLPTDRRSKTALAVRELFEQTAGSVVLIKTGTGSGSGICITDDGIILTCNHVLDARSNLADVTLFAWKDGRMTPTLERKGRVVFREVDHDIALLDVGPVPTFLKALSLAEKDAETGTKIIALGSPVMGNAILPHTITEGIVNASERILDGQRFLQHSAAVNPGNSGGPILSLQGEVVGLVTLKASLENVSFAIPVSRLREVLQTVKR